MMLSRIADSLFWIGRYMERADNTARILDVNYHMLLEQPPDTYKLRWDPLIAITGERSRFYKIHDEASAHTAFEFLGFADENPNSIAQCIVRRVKTPAPFATASRASFGKISTPCITRS